MTTRIINRDRRRGWRYYRVLSRTLLYVGVIAAVACAPVLLFTLSGLWEALWLLLTLLGLCVVLFAFYAYFVGKIRR